MTAGSGDTSLATLDHPPTRTCEPGIWAGNLAALHAVHPTLAAALADLELPGHWRPVRGLDDSPTYLLHPPGQMPTWLGSTAAPRTRARGVLAVFRPADKNYALPTCGTGAEIENILQRLKPHQALYVFVQELHECLALLRTWDLATALRSFRCILVPAERAAADLSELLRANPGLAPPGEIVLPDLVAPEQLAALRSLGERLQRQWQADQATRLEALRNALRARAPASGPRLALLALTPDAVARGAAEAVARAAEQLGWPHVCRLAHDPRDAVGLAHAEALAAFRPTLTVYVQCRPLSAQAGGRTFMWVLEPPVDQTELCEDEVDWLAASPHIEEKLKALGAPAERVMPWYWGCDAVPDDEVTAAPPPGAPVLLVGDLPNLDPASRAITQPTHKRLWSELLKAARQGWGVPRAIDPEMFLRRAERQCACELRGEDLRESMRALIEHVLLPGVTLEALVDAVRQAGYGVVTIGSGWQRLSAGQVDVGGRTYFESTEALIAARPRAVIIAGNVDPLGPTVLAAAARGWPLLIHHPQGHSREAALGGILVPEQHYQPFVDVGQLCKALELLCDGSPEVQRRTAAARAEVRARHSYGQRLASLGARRA